MRYHTENISIIFYSLWKVTVVQQCPRDATTGTFVEPADAAPKFVLKSYGALASKLYNAELAILKKARLHAHHCCRARVCMVRAVLSSLAPTSILSPLSPPPWQSETVSEWTLASGQRGGADDSVSTAHTLRQRRLSSHVGVVPHIGFSSVEQNELFTLLPSSRPLDAARRRQRSGGTQ